jgi:hypothetical protein
VIAIDRPGMNDHLMRPCGLTQQFPAPNPSVPAKDGITVLRDPHQVVFAVPNGMAASFVRFHPTSPYGKRCNPSCLKAWGFLIPYRGL